MHHRFKAVLFDLDGTLLHSDHDALNREYLRTVSEAFRGKADPSKIPGWIMEGYQAMLDNNGNGMTARDAFLARFEALSKMKPQEFEPVFIQYYIQAYPALKSAAHARPQHGGRKAVLKAREAGLKTMVATNAIYPIEAVRARLAWAGHAESDFDAVATYDRFTCIKPHPGYFLQCAAFLEVQPQECIMAGNDAQEDLVAEKTGMAVYFIKDIPINRSQRHPDCPTGTLNEFCGWLESQI
jgi:FMN phosphatase YigB (HAD superfamily)